MAAARRAEQGKRSAAALRLLLASAAISSRVNSSKISFGSRPAPSMCSLWTAGSTSGMPPNSMRMAAPRAAGCGRVATCRYWIASPASARSRLEARAIGVRAHLLQFALAGRARDVAAEQLPQGFEFEDFSAGFHECYLYLRRLRKAFSITPSVPSVICRSFRPAGLTHSTRQTSSPAQSVAAGDAAEVIDQHVVVFRCCPRRRA